MQQLRIAMEQTTTHGLPRMVTNKPLYVRVAWLLFFLFMLGTFLNGFVHFIKKLQANEVINTLEVGALAFKFPDVYACFENPVSGSYPANLDARSAEAINDNLNSIAEIIRHKLELLPFIFNETVSFYEKVFSFLKIQSMPYNLMIDALAHRVEQSVLKSTATYKNDFGIPSSQLVDVESFYHPGYLRCFKWRGEQLEKFLQSGPSTGLIVTLLLDGNSSAVASNGAEVLTTVYAGDIPVPLSDWTLSVSDFNEVDRRAGVRFFITPQGEYPSDYVTSFSLGPGKHHNVEISMTQQEFKEGQFDCVSDVPDVQYVNPYDDTPYNNTYGYSYCIYYEYHRHFQMLTNMSGMIGPLPYPLRGPKFLFNLTGEPTFLNAAVLSQLVNFNPTSSCQSRKPCSTFDYTVSISSVDWPTQSSLAPFVSSTVKQAWRSAKAMNLSVPALDFLVSGNASYVDSFVRSNLLKVHFKPHRVACDKVEISKKYDGMQFISDVGGILGIYLGMSLLTLCELFELIYDLIVQCYTKRSKSTRVSAVIEFSTIDAQLSSSSSVAVH